MLPLHSIPTAAFVLSPPVCTLLPARKSNRHRLSAATPNPSTAIHQDEDGNCIFGKKEYWDQMYDGDLEEGDIDQRPSDRYSWYCGWEELQPWWSMLVPDQKSRVVVAGIGNDPTPVGMYDAGWTNVLAYDYSQSGVDRAKELFNTGRARDKVEFITADARNLPMETGSVDATLDKGTLDAIFITGKDIFQDSVKEMGRVTATGGRVICISTVIWSDDLLHAFDNTMWENVHDGSLAFALDGEATIDLGAELYSWKRTDVPYAD